MEKLYTGVAYHGNRILRHVEEDMAELCRCGMNTVVHMFSHNDWDRHLGVMKDIVKISENYGLDVWIDYWGLGGPPGDKSHFLQYHPEAHQVYSDGTVDPVSSCYNNPAFIQFTKDWLDTVREFGGKKIMWDEPRLKVKKEAWQMENGEAQPAFTCCCPTCKKLFEERYHHPMPTAMTEEVVEFRAYTMTNFFDTVTSYAKSIGLENIVIVMPRTLDYTKQIIQLPSVDNFGIDPYWHPGNPVRAQDPYDYVYSYTKEALKLAQESGKQSHIWIQGYDIPAGYEDEIVVATDAAYEAGARTILAWSFRGGESNSYRAEHCDRTWQAICEGMARVRNRHFDRILEENRKRYQNK